MNTAASYAARPFMAAIRRVRETAHDYGVSNTPHAMLWLFQSYALSAGMYGCQVWSTGYLQPAQAQTLAVRVRHLGFLKQLLGVRRSTCNATVLRESGQLPLEF